MAASPIRTIMPERAFSQGEVFESPPLTVGRLERYSRLRVYRLGWPDTGADVIKVTQLYNSDNGPTWIEFGGFTARGGDYFLKDGSLLQFHTFETSAFPDADNPQRKIKVRIEALAPLSTSVDAETSDTQLAKAK